MWIHQDAFLDLSVDVEYNIFGPKSDHQFLDLQFGNQSHLVHTFDRPPVEHRFLKAGSDAEGDLILDILGQTLSWASLSSEEGVT